MKAIDRTGGKRVALRFCWDYQDSQVSWVQTLRVLVQHIE